MLNFCTKLIKCESFKKNNNKHKGNSKGFLEIKDKSVESLYTTLLNVWKNKCLNDTKMEEMNLLSTVYEKHKDPFHSSSGTSSLSLI